MTTPNATIKLSAERRAQGLRLRSTPELRRAALDTVVMKIIKTKGVAEVTLKTVAAAAECSSGLVGRYYGGADAMRLAAVNMLAAADGDSKALRRVFADGFDPKTKGLKLPKGFKV